MEDKMKDKTQNEKREWHYAVQEAFNAPFPKNVASAFKPINQAALDTGSDERKALQDLREIAQRLGELGWFNAAREIAQISLYLEINQVPPVDKSASVGDED